MDIRKQLAFSIIKFLRTELDSKRLGEEGTEALEVAVQCLESAYYVEEGVKSNDEIDLLPIFQSAVGSTYSPGSTSNTMYPDANQVNKEMAESKKVEGNDHMRDGKFNDAIGSYSNAIDLDPHNAIYYCNRAAAYAKLNDNKNSIVDCEKALKIDATYSKAYGRMGLAYFNDENYEQAIASYEHALSLDPANQPYKVQLDSSREKLNSRNSVSGAQPAAAPAPPNPLAGMDLGSLLSNPAVMNMAQNFMSNPQVQNMFANMMGGGAGGAPAGAPASQAPEPMPQQEGATAVDPNLNNAGAGGFGGIDFSTVLNATSQFAAQMQQQNPDVVENLRAQFRQEAPMPTVPPPDEKEEQPK